VYLDSYRDVVVAAMRVLMLGCLPRAFLAHNSGAQTIASRLPARTPSPRKLLPSPPGQQHPSLALHINCPGPACPKDHRILHFKMPTTLQEFESVWPRIRADLQQHAQQYKLPQDSLDWFTKVPSSHRVALAPTCSCLTLVSRLQHSGREM
jgi:hypothetical protein